MEEVYKFFFEVYKNAFQEWNEGEIVEVWKEEQGEVLWW